MRPDSVADQQNGSVYSFPVSKVVTAIQAPVIQSKGMLLQAESPTGLILLLQEGCVMTESNEFKMPGSGIVIKLKQVTNIHGQEGKMLTVQVLLMQPERDVLQVRVSTDSSSAQPLTASLCKLSSDSRSLILELRPRRKMDLDGEGSIYRSYVFSLEVVNNPWKESFASIAVTDPDLTIVCKDGRQIETLKQLLGKSNVLQQKTTADNIKEISLDYPLDIVQEMIRFLMHGYCCLWDSETHFPQLVRIAEELAIGGMRVLADNKKRLLN